MAKFSYIRSCLLAVVAGVVFWCVLVPSGLYLFPHGGQYEQAWLNTVISHLRIMRANCDDSDLQGVLDYTIQRYNRIGPFDVSVQWTVNLLPTRRALAYNAPYLPGLTLDHSLLIDYPLEYGAVVLCHEALHDYYPWFGHDHITAREAKLYELSRRCQ